MMCSCIQLPLQQLFTSAGRMPVLFQTASDWKISGDNSKYSHEDYKIYFIAEMLYSKGKIST